MQDTKYKFKSIAEAYDNILNEKILMDLPRRQYGVYRNVVRDVNKIIQLSPDPKKYDEKIDYRKEAVNLLLSIEDAAPLLRKELDEKMKQLYNQSEKEKKQQNK